MDPAEVELLCTFGDYLSIHTILDSLCTFDLQMIGTVGSLKKLNSEQRSRLRNLVEAFVNSLFYPDASLNKSLLYLKKVMEEKCEYHGKHVRAFDFMYRKLTAVPYDHNPLLALSKKELTQLEIWRYELEQR